VVGKAGKVAAVFLGEKGFDVFSFFGIVELERVVRACSQKKFSRIIEVEGCDCCFGFGEFEQLRMGQQFKNVSRKTRLPLRVSVSQSLLKSFE